MIRINSNQMQMKITNTLPYIIHFCKSHLINWLCNKSVSTQKITWSMYYTVSRIKTTSTSKRHFQALTITPASTQTFPQHSLWHALNVRNTKHDSQVTADRYMTWFSNKIYYAASTTTKVRHLLGDLMNGTGKVTDVAWRNASNWYSSILRQIYRKFFSQSLRLPKQ